MPGFGEENQTPFGARGAAPTARVRPPTHLSKDEFCRWIDRQEAKFEWKEGRVVQMSNVTRGHASIVANLSFALLTALGRDRWRVLTSDFGIESGDFLRFPDVVVEPKLASTGSMTERRVVHPVLIFEVLSPSSVGIDMIEKPAEYGVFATLEAYVAVSQDTAQCWLWQRDAAGAFPSRPAAVVGRGAALQLDARGISLPLAEIYFDIPTSDD